MRVKPTNPDHAVGLVDPHTKRRPFIDPVTGAVLESADVPENTHWVRRLQAGEIVRVDDAAKPAGGAPASTATSKPEK